MKYLNILDLGVLTY